MARNAPPPAPPQPVTPPSFTFVPVRARRDGWTPRRQALFIFTLTQVGCIDAACRHVGLSQQSAYKLRGRADAASFRHAWNEALERHALASRPAQIGRAMDGVATPITYAGRQVGERRRHDNRLGMFLLQVHGRDP